MKLIYGTGNGAKLSSMKERLAGLPLELVGLKELCLDLPEAPEDGASVEENARKKAIYYYNCLKSPVFSLDTGLYFENMPENLQPGHHARRVNGKELTDEEMTAYYGGLAKKFGNLTAYYKHAICLVMDEEHIYETVETSEKFLFTSVSKGIRRPGFPLDGMCVDLKTGKYYYDLGEEAVKKIAVADGMRDFFQKIAKLYGEDA